MPAAVLVLDFTLHGTKLAGHFREQRVPIGYLQHGGDIAERAAHVGFDEIQKLSSNGSESADVKAAVQNHDGDVHTHQEIVQVVGQHAQIEIAVQQFLVQGSGVLRWRTEAPPWPFPALHLCSAIPRCSKESPRGRPSSPPGPFRARRSENLSILAWPSIPVRAWNPLPSCRPSLEFSGGKLGRRFFEDNQEVRFPCVALT